MNDTNKSGSGPVEGMAWPEFARRMAWIAIQLILVYCFADEFQPFFYQAF